MHRKSTVHPHGRGERLLPINSAAISLAVHPHGRGERLMLTRSWNKDCPVHPHGRGERAETVAVIVQPDCGSSPRAWGTRYQANIGMVVSTTVHPHGRGERHPGLCGRSVSYRFIPTGVGNASMSAH